MVKTVSATEAKNNLGAVLRVVESGESVIVENRREAVCAILSFAFFEEKLIFLMPAEFLQVLENQ